MLYNNFPNYKKYTLILASKIYFGFAGKYLVIITYINEKIILFKIIK